MAVDAATFRADFPEFSDTTAYPNAVVNFWLSIAAKLILEKVWLDVHSFGIELFTAHNLALERQAQTAAASGQVPGSNTGPVSQKSVDKLSVSYDGAAGLVPDAGHWNLTTYGTRFIQLARLAGAGGYQAGAGAAFGSPGTIVVTGYPYG